MDWYEKGMGERFSTFHAVLLAIWLAVLVWSGISRIRFHGCFSIRNAFS